jgi:hypothetical protein
MNKRARAKEEKACKANENCINKQKNGEEEATKEGNLRDYRRRAIKIKIKRTSERERE